MIRHFQVFTSPRKRSLALLTGIALVVFCLPLNWGGSRARAQETSPPSSSVKPATKATKPPAGKGKAATKASTAAKTATSAKPNAKATVTSAGKTEPKTKTATAAKAEAKNSPEQKTAGGPGGKPVLVASYGDWGAYLTQSGKGKICYALAQPKDRAPPKLKRDPAYVFISNRPGEGVRNEVSIIMGFPLKESGSDARADIGGVMFDLVAKGQNAWVKNPAEEGQFVDAVKKGAKLVVKAPSTKGNVTTDSYSLAGLSQALDRVQKECP